MAVGAPPVAAAIIAGGAASRVGGLAKPFLEVGGRTIAQRQLAVLRPLFPRTVVVANEPDRWRELGVDQIVPDRVRGAGPLAAIEVALACASGGDVVCVAGDLPFLSPALLLALRDRPSDAPALVPRPSGRAEPLCARYGASMMPLVSARLAERRLALHAVLKEVDVAWLDDSELAGLDPDGATFFNVNTLEDLARAEVMARQRDR